MRITVSVCVCMGTRMDTIGKVFVRCAVNIAHRVHYILALINILNKKKPGKIINQIKAKTMWQLTINNNKVMRDRIHWNDGAGFGGNITRVLTSIQYKMWLFLVCRTFG